LAANLPGHLETVALLGGELKGSPPGWRRVCRVSRPHGRKGGRIQQRAEHNAGYFGLDEEIFRATTRLLGASENTPRLRTSGNRGPCVSSVKVCLSPTVTADRPMCRGNLKDQVSPVGCREQYAQLYQPGIPCKKRLSVSPEVILGGFIFSGMRPAGIPYVLTTGDCPPDI